MQGKLRILVAILVGAVAFIGGSTPRAESQNRRFLFPGTLCVSESDEDDTNYEGSFFRVRNGYDLVCPFFWMQTFDRYQSSPSLSQETGFRVTDITANSRARLTIVDNSGGSNAFASVCAPNNDTSLSFTCSVSVTSAACTTGAVCTLSDLFPNDVNSPSTDDMYHLQITLPNDGSRIIRYEIRQSP